MLKIMIDRFISSIFDHYFKLKALCSLEELWQQIKLKAEKIGECNVIIKPP